MSEDATSDLVTDLKALVVKRGAKDTKRSARGRFNRRKVLVAHALDQLMIAIDEVVNQDGKTYKKDELDKFKTAIDAFKKSTGLDGIENAVVSKEMWEHLEAVFNLAAAPYPFDKDDEVGSQ